jgi:hypothetical protein
VNEFKDILLKDRVMPLMVGQRVLAIHPKTNEIKTGSILTSEGNRYDVRFDDQEFGISLVRDYNIIPIAMSKSLIKQ